MITETIIVALITSAFTFAGVLVANWSIRKKTDVEQAQRDQKDLPFPQGFRISRR